MSEGNPPAELRLLDSGNPCKACRLVADPVEPSADGVVLLDHDFNVRQISAVATRILCLSAAASSSLLGRNIADLFGEDRSNGLHRQCEAVLETGEPLTVHKALGDTGNGNPSLRITIFRSETGLGMIVSDVTPCREAKEALRRSEERYRLVVENASEAIIVAQEGASKLVNTKAAEIAGYSCEELASTPFAEFLHPDDRQMVLDHHQRRSDGQDVPPVYQSRVITKPGEVRWVEINGVRIEWEGRPATLNFVRDITERREADEALRESERRFRNVLDNSLDMIYQLNLRTGKYDYVSPSSAKVIGYEPAEFLGLTFEAAATLVHPDDMERLAANVVQLISRALNGSKSNTAEYRFRHKKLGYRWMNDTRSVVLDEFGRPGAIVGTLRDITDRKRADQAIRASEAQFRSVFNYAAMGIVLLDPDCHFVRINPAFRHMLGYSVKELRSMAPGEYIHVDDVAIDAALFKELIKGSRNHYHVEKRLIDRDGRVITCRTVVSAVRDFSGRLLYAIAMIEDLTERKLAEEALMRSEERFRALIENTQDVIAVMDEDRTITFNTPSVEKILGYTPEELFGIDAFDFIHPDDQPPALATLQHVISAPGEPHNSEVRARHKDGSWRTIEIVATNLDADPAVRGIVLNFRDVTKRREAEDALRDSERKFRCVLDNSLDMVYQLDLETSKYEYVSPSSAKVIGYDPAEFLGFTLKTSADLTHPDDIAGVSANFLDLLSQENGSSSANSAEYRFRHKTLGYRWMRDTRSLVFDEHNAPKAVVGGLEDVTERREAEEALRDSERDYRILFDSVMEGLVVIDAETLRLVLANEAAARNCDFDSVEEILEADFFEYIHPDDRERAARIIGEDIFQNDLRQVNEFRIITKHGDERWLSGVGTRIEYRGRVAGLGSFTDITRHKRTEEELKGHRRQLEHLIDERTSDLSFANAQLRQQIADTKRVEDNLRIKDSAIASSINAIAIADARGIILYVNSAFLRLWGYDTESDVIGVSGDHFWRMGSKTLDLLEAFHEMHDWTGDLVARRKDGTLFDVHVSASTVPDESGAPSYFMASFIDITERKRSEAKLEKLYNRERRLRQQLEEEMNRRIEFTRALAHELKTPLTPVLMSSQVLASQLNEPTMVKLANNVARGASNLNSRIDELLDLAKGEIGMLHLKPEQVDILQLLREITEEVASIPASHHQSFFSKLPPSLPPSLPPVQADRTRLRQIVVNLLNNAFKYTPEGGRITLGARHDDSNLIIEIDDTGPGISKEEQQRLFQPYHRLESDRERLSGLGLGLALSKTLVELHGGRIWVESSTKGSTFAFSLPFQQPTIPDETP